MPKFPDTKDQLTRLSADKILTTFEWDIRAFLYILTNHVSNSDLFFAL